MVPGKVDKIPAPINLSSIREQTGADKQIQNENRRAQELLIPFFFSSGKEQDGGAWVDVHIRAFHLCVLFGFQRNTSPAPHPDTYPCV